MSVPNGFDIAEAVYASGLYDLTTHDGQADFIDAVVADLHARDKRWGHLRKRPEQTNIHGHAEDAALYLSDTPGLSQAVDFIGGAGGPHPQIQWNVDLPRYSQSDWFAPQDHDLAPIPPVPVPTLKPRDQFYAELREVNAFYASQDGLQRPGGMVKFDDHGRPVADVEALGAWGYDLMSGKTVDECKAAIRQSGEWKAKHP